LKLCVEHGLDLLFEGDPAPTQPFEDLVNINSESALGENGVKLLIPWLKNNNDYRIVVCDPRVKSPQLREATKLLSSELPAKFLSRLIVINADTPSENRKWLKKSNILNVNVYSDEKREWMRSYTALGENRWSMTMFVLADERMQKIAREMVPISATRAVENAVNAMESRRL
jgi:peroxiredoxin